MLIALWLVLPGCGRPDVDVCEKFIKDGLATPATYRRAEMKMFDDEPIAPAEYYAKTGLPDTIRSDLPIVRQLAQLNRSDRIILRHMFIRYDASNGAGVPVRSIGGCVFKIVNEIEPARDELESALISSLARTSTRDAVERGMLPDKYLIGLPNPYYDCCLPR